MDLLHQHGITAVCDVRSTPYSRVNPQFNRETIKAELQNSGIAYVFLGNELGARTENSACYIDGKVQYRLLAQQPSFRDGLNRIREGMERYVVALMCAEKDAITCHRTILVCRALRDPEISISHIGAEGDLESHEAAELRLMQFLQVEPDMFHSETTCIEKAYDLQADRIAYVRKSPAVAMNG
jgi:uncharacterized protein (DUF488 family)